MITTRIESESPAQRWEDAMISGNGSTGIMVLGRPLEEKIIINHEKLWVVMARQSPSTPDLSAAWVEARAMAFEGRYRDAHEHFEQQRRAWWENSREAEEAPAATRIPYDHIHPGLHLEIETESGGPVRHYCRETLLTTGEVRVAWSDTVGAWERRAFVSRTDDAIVIQYRAPSDAALKCRLRLREAPGKGIDEMGPVTVRHTASEMYFHAAYARTMGRAAAEGYHLLARVVPSGGRTQVVQDEGINLAGADSVLVIMRLEYLDDAGAADIDALRGALGALPADYDALLQAHAAVHAEMFERVTLDLGSASTDFRSSEALIADGITNGASPRLLETAHAVGRYAQVCGGTGTLPVALSGIWGNDWAPPWDGRYTFDANINLSISGASQGALPEVIETYCRYIEASVDDWRYNAGQVFGCRGLLPDLCQAWRHGRALMLYPWAGGAGRLLSYLYDQ
jgi:alpha-L-fucosidase 2